MIHCFSSCLIKKMKHITLFFTLLVYASASAQVNPMQGYVITNNNDTIHGMIDYRSDAKNALECHFKENGQSDYRTYAPSDISGYRFTDDGIY